VGLGCCIQVLTLVAQNSVSAKDMASASATVNFMRSMGGVLGVSVSGTIFSGGINTYLSDHLPPGISIPPGQSTSFNADNIGNIPEPLRDIILNAYAYALRNVFLACVPVCGLAALIGLFLKHVELSKVTGEAGGKKAVEKPAVELEGTAPL